MKAYDRDADAGDKGAERYRSDVVPTESGTLETAGPKSVIERARLELARVSVKQTSEMTRALQRATEVAAHAIDVERAGVWLLAGSELLCVHQFVRAGATHSEGQSITLAAIPSYVRAIHERRVLQADNAMTHPSTSELAESYLVPLGIGAMLDAPIFREGDVVGVICLEHVGGARAWTPREVDFACSVADIVATVFEQDARLEAEARRREADAAAERGRRMEALVRMGAELAHDFKNLMHAISLGSDVLRRESEPQAREELAKYLGDEARKATRLVDDLLAFCREQSHARASVDMGAIVRDLETRLRVLVGERCSVDIDFPGEPLPLMADASQIERVVTNLFTNARDAMPAGGVVALRLSKIVHPRGQSFALLEVRDQGLGMDDATRERIFEPFFTTKERGKGTGLGLSAVLGIVEQNGGRVSLESAVGQGSVFRVFWPLA